MPYTPVEKVREFNERFGFKVHRKPTIPDEKTIQLRIDLIAEEFEEFAAASRAKDIVGVADGIADLLYVVYGAAHAWGIPVEEIFDEVHRSNMSKVHENGEIVRLPNGKVVKPLNYSPPNIREILELRSTGHD